MVVSTAKGGATDLKVGGVHSASEASRKKIVPPLFVHWGYTWKINFELEMWANAQPDGRLPNIGGALCSTPQSLADAHY